MARFSRCGKPLCARCSRLATKKFPYRSFGKLRFVYYCSVHALLVSLPSLLQEVRS